MTDKTITVKELLRRKILVLDGAMGTMLQSKGLSDRDFNSGVFADHPIPLKGNNDVLCITRPDAVLSVHQAYLDAGADIIETNTFNSNCFSQADYGLESHVYDLAKAGAMVARRAADLAMKKNPDKMRFVAGSIGPSGRTASMSPSVEDPASRNVSFDELAATFQLAAEGLIDGGADLLLIETVFDTLNAKAAIYGIGNAMRGRNVLLPVMISATLSDASGRMLAGQSAEAFLNSVTHAEGLLTVGFNCALGPEEMRPHLAELSRKAPCFVSAHPNAGLPDEFGRYLQTPEKMGRVIRSFAEDGLVNIVGGCCGTTPAHIAEIARAVDGVRPRIPADPPACLRLSGLDPFNATADKNFINVGERTNVAGSRKFLNLIKSGDLPAAMAVAGHQVENGASILDVNMDDPMLNPVESMVRFLNYLASEPEISRVPVMLDSSNWDVIAAGLRCVQGKGIVNSISLKEGAESFLKKAREIRRLGAAVLVMAFDEQGQADTVARRVDICSRAFDLLTREAGVPPQDIVFDVNVFAIATGMKEHDSYAVDFIDAVRILKKKYPLCGFSGGISNVSFSFRGNDVVRGAIHTVFLKHAIDAGLTMGIVNAAQLGVYEDLDPALREAAEAVVLNRDPGASERLLAIASGIRSEHREIHASGEWRKEPLPERIVRSLVKGDDSYAETDMAEALKSYPTPMAIVEGPLMDGMSKVGELFSSGRMFLPQVVKSARVMKRSVACLMPAIEASRGPGASYARTVVLATVKGDVHDIGKNIVSVVLQCNNSRVVDLGVMVPENVIVDAAVKENADLIGLSGLITPSLDEIIHVVEELERRGLKIPVLIGGAATSMAHTALRIQPHYSAPVVYTRDASASVPAASSLTNPEKREIFITTLQAEYARLRDASAHHRATVSLVSAEEARARAEVVECQNEPPHRPGVHSFRLTWTEIAPCFDWDGFLRNWDMPKACCAQELLRDAKLILEKHVLVAHCVCGIFPAASGEDTIRIFDDESRSSVKMEFPVPRQRGENSSFRSICDFLSRKNPDWLGAFALSVSGAEEPASAYAANHDDYSALLLKTLANRFAEAAAEYVHMKLRREYWGYESGKVEASPELLKLKYRGIRPAPGYPMLPDHALKKNIFDLLSVTEHCGTVLTETFMMVPQASVCAFCIANPGATYFSI